MLRSNFFRPEAWKLRTEDRASQLVSERKQPFILEIKNTDKNVGLKCIDGAAKSFQI